MRHALFVSALLLLLPIGTAAIEPWAMAGPTSGQTTKAVGEPAIDTAQLRQRAEAGDRRAQYDLAQRIRAGRGRKAKREAEGWFQKASNQGYALATHMLAVMYARGEFDYTNPVTAAVALDGFKEAAEQGLAWSALAVADTYARGQGIKRDPQLVCQWTLVAEGLAARGDWDAEIPKTVNAARRELPDRLARARNSLASGQIAACEEQAAEWLRTHPALK